MPHARPDGHVEARRGVAATVGAFLSEVPRSGWLVVALGVLRSSLLAVMLVVVGFMIDRLAAAQPIAGELAAALILLAGAALVVAVQASIPAPAQAVLEREWRERVMRSLVRLTVDDREPLGTRAAMATEEIERFAQARASFFGQFVAAMVAPLAVLVVIGATLSWTAAGVLLCAIAIIPPVIAWFMASFRAGTGRFRRVSGQLAGVFVETMRSIDTIRLLGAGSQRRQVLSERSHRLRREAMAVLARNQVVLLVTDGVFGLLVLALVGVLGTTLMMTGSLTIGEATALLLLSVLLREPADSLGRSFYVGLAGRAAGDRVRRVADSAGPRHSMPQVAANERGALVLRDVNVDRGGRRILSDVTWRIDRGFVAIIGRSGGGKSTLGLVMAGLVEPTATSGEVVWQAQEGVTSSPRSAVAIIPQRTVLIEGTVRDNLRLAAPRADDETLRRALRSAGFAESDAELSHGLDTRIGSDVRGVSGGQATRLAIARALLVDRPVIVADEPTASLDSESAARVMATLRELSQERVVMVITHRRDDLCDDDAVALVADGRLARVADSGAVAPWAKVRDHISTEDAE